MAIPKTPNKSTKMAPAYSFYITNTMVCIHLLCGCLWGGKSFSFVDFLSRIFFLCLYLRFSFDLIQPVCTPSIIEYVIINRGTDYCILISLFTFQLNETSNECIVQLVEFIHKICFKNEVEHIIIMMVKEPKKKRKRISPNHSNKTKNDEKNAF